MIALPGYIDREAWDGFEAMRKTIKKPLTDRARKLVVYELDVLRKEVQYNPVDGSFARLVVRSHNAGKRADRKGHHGYMFVSILKCRFLAHRLAWFFTYGAWPDGEIDHINGNTSDNRIENLRIASREQNCGNVVKKPGACGVFGVYKQRNTRRYRASITVNSKRKHLGYFDTIEEAHQVALAALDAHRGDFSPAERIRGAR